MLRLTQPQLRDSTLQRRGNWDTSSTDTWCVLLSDEQLTSKSLIDFSIFGVGSYLFGAAIPVEIYSTAPVASLFEHLRHQWYRERGASSSIVEAAMCPAYQRIIAMGQDAVPLILRQLESEEDQPDMWFWALRVLINADPVSDDDRGDVVAMARTWLSWSRGRYAW